MLPPNVMYQKVFYINLGLIYYNFKVISLQFSMFYFNSLKKYCEVGTQGACVFLKKELEAGTEGR